MNNPATRTPARTLTTRNMTSEYARLPMRFGVNGTTTSLRERQRPPSRPPSHVVIPNLDQSALLIQLSSTEMSQIGKHRDTGLAILKKPCVACHTAVPDGPGKCPVRRSSRGGDAACLQCNVKTGPCAPSAGG